MKKIWLFFLILLLTLSVSSQKAVDSLLYLCKSAPEKQKSGLYLELSSITRSDTSKSNTYSRMALKLAIDANEIEGQGKAYYFMGETCFYSRDFAGAIPFYEKAIPIYEQLKDTFLLTNCYSSIGLCYHNMYLGDKAIAKFIQALKLTENNKEYTAEIIANIAVAHAKMNNQHDAIINFRKALSINQTIKDSVSMAADYNGLGDAFMNQSRYDSSLVNFLKAFHIFKKMKKNAYEAIAIANLASVYSNYPDSLKKALIFFKQASAKFNELDMNVYQAEIQQGIGSVLCKQGNYTDALKAYTESYKLTKEYNRGLALEKSYYQGLSDLYAKKSDYKMALKYHILFAQYADSLDQKEKYERLINVEKQYETEKKEKEILRLHAKQELTDVQMHKDKQIKQLGFITVTILLAFVFFVLVKYFDKIKSNKLLEEKNVLIEQSEQELRTLNAAKNKFFSIIAHDLKNPFHNVLGYSHLLSKDYDHFTEDERRKFALDINQSANSIFRLLQNLLEWSRSQTGRLKFSPTEIEFKRILENSVSVLHGLAEQKKIQLSYDYTSELKVFADPLMIETVLRNLINNAIKFTPENGSVRITAQLDGKLVKVSVIDTGIGISESDIENLFRIDSKVKRKGTNDEDGSGLGLILCKEFVDKNKGAIWAESIQGQGSTFVFTIPVKSFER